MQQRDQEEVKSHRKVYSKKEIRQNETDLIEKPNIRLPKDEQEELNFLQMQFYMEEQNNDPDLFNYHSESGANYPSVDEEEFKHYYH
eukprot:CAMPEP_0170552492 /NCGR_PEP_ID=MMETSP0211-20121228/10370_1 /TAXON_ID=311385 /ORGANISM="Pseudokeronopsis sp., Strain OXSARD2" /LENGTH=86 /DNA_ID=CAMNT_0010860233 /DNA_START=375 /DNA_END=635 /DNA_ORIENTATION=+